MTLPRTAAEVLSGHVRLEVRCTGRLMLTFRQPRLQYGQGIDGFFCQHRGNQFASSVLMLPMTGRFTDAGFGPFRIKFCGYFPCTGQIYLNGHEYAKQQRRKAGIAFTALDNAFGMVSDPAADPADLRRADRAYKAAIADLARQASPGIQPPPVTNRRSRQAPVVTRNPS